MLEPTDLVLVAILNNRRDLEVVRLLGWYRIPLRSAPKLVSVDAVAFYQTAAFAEERWSIRRYARVCGVELVRRAELFQDEENHPRAREEYYKLQLGPLETLARPVVSRTWRRLTFFYTTGERLLNSEEVGGLAIPTADRKSLWRALRDRGYPEVRGFGPEDFSPWADAMDALFESTRMHGQTPKKPE
ncbi:MAG: hypothetical protein JW929_11780 [Anaerolineales bacterium]|nr:hypothetical protein [Anaerolineales bacterium]